MPYDIFISYRRNGGEYTAKILRDHLDEMGYRVFFDVESLRSGDFNTKLYSVIDECTDFLLILSPGALDRCAQEGDWVRREVEYALEKGKNIVPVMLRGFEFPEVLPEPLEPLRYRNGLEANSQFFDAFLQQLTQKFLLTKPALRRRVAQSSLVRRTLPFLLALVILAGGIFGVRTLLHSLDSTYPRTKAEESLVGEVLYYAENNLTRLDLMADAMYDALNASRRYLSSGSTDYASLRDTFAVSRQTLEQLDLTPCVPSDGFLDRLTDSPFVFEDTIAMYDNTEQFRAECTENLAYLESLTSPTFFLSTEEKLLILDCYEIILEQTLQANAYCCNQLLLPITAGDGLDTFHHTYLPELTCVPLSVTEWETDYDLLETSVSRCLNTIEKAQLDLATLVGNTNIINAALYDALIQVYVSAGYTRTEAEYLITTYQEESTSIAESLSSLRDASLPQAGDDEDTLWFKMMELLAYAFYDDALTCVDAYEALVKDIDPYAADHITALRRFVSHCRSNGLTYGAMVTAYYEPDGINEVFEIGDIIIAFNGEPCGSYTTYTQLKSQCEGAYTVTVLRADAAGELDTVELELTTDMPRVTINTVVNVGTDY